MSEDYDDGHEQGYEEGYEFGYEEGYNEGCSMYKEDMEILKLDHDEDKLYAIGLIKRIHNYNGEKHTVWIKTDEWKEGTYVPL